MIKKVEGNSPGRLNWNISILSEILASKSQYKNAAKLLKPVCSKSERPEYISSYWEYAVKGKTRSHKEILSDILKLIHNNNSSLTYFGKYLLENGYYKEAFVVLDKVSLNVAFKRQNHLHEQVLLNMALAWRMSGGSDDKKAKIKAMLNEVKKDRWLTSRVLFLFGEISEGDLFQIADLPKKRGEIYHYLGTITYREGNRDDDLKYLLISLETKLERQNGYKHAYNLAEKLAG